MAAVWLSGVGREQSRGWEPLITMKPLAKNIE